MIGNRAADIAETGKAKRKRENNRYAMEITVKGKGTKLPRREQVKERVKRKKSARLNYKLKAHFYCTKIL